MEEKIIGEFQKNPNEKVICQFTTFKQKELIDIRIFFADDDGTWKPTRKGLCLLRSLVLELREVLDKAAAEYDKELPGPEQEKGTKDEGEPGEDEETLPF
jgi:hypothetical protein